MAWWTAPAVAAIAQGVLSTAGQIQSNNQNKQIAREQMRFQERMSSTAAQRAVEDYRRAGLNPALAYDRPASSPGGASAVMGNAVETGINSARSALEKQQSLRLARQQELMNTKQNTLMDAQIQKTQAEERKAMAEQRAIDQRTSFDAAYQPYMLRQQAAQALMQELGISEAKANSRFYEVMGAGAPALGMLTGTAGSAAAALSALSRASTAAKAARGATTIINRTRSRGGSTETRRTIPRENP